MKEFMRRRLTVRRQDPVPLMEDHPPADAEDRRSPQDTQDQEKQQDLSHCLSHAYASQRSGFRRNRKKSYFFDGQGKSAEGQEQAFRAICHEKTFSRRTRARRVHERSAILSL